MILLSPALIGLWALGVAQQPSAAPDARHWCGVERPPLARALPGYVREPSRSADPVDREAAAIDGDATTAIIDVLILYSDGFVASFPTGYSIGDEVATAVGLLNAALSNSGVDAEVRAAAVEHLASLPDDGANVLSFLADDKTVLGRRDELHADLVYALIDDPTASAGAACVPGAYGSLTSEECFAGYTNKFGSTIWRTIFRHEVGHNLGLQHSPEEGGDPTWGFVTGTVGYCGGACWGRKESTEESYGTVMSGNTVPRFSTSKELWESLVIGEAGIHEATTALESSVGYVAAYRSADQTRPRPPTLDAPTVVGVNESKLEVTWTKPAATPAITGFRFRVREVGAAGWSVYSLGASTTSVAVAGLKETTKYEVQLRAVNEHRFGYWSDSGVGETKAAQTPNQAPTIGDTGPLALDIDENAAGGTELGVEIQASDADGDPLTWSLRGTDKDAFTISSAGQIATAGATRLDYEAQSSYAFEAEVSDGRGGVDSIVVKVTVNDLNEPPPAPSDLSVKVRTSTSVRVSWAAPDVTGRPPIEGYAARYREKDAAGGSGWKVHEFAGTWTWTNLTDLSPGATYEVQVRATNAEGTGAWSASAEGATRENRPPEFIEGAAAPRSVAENAALGTDLGDPLTASDPDEELLTYALADGADASSFAIASDTGQLRTNAALNHETRSTYSVTVTASDDHDGTATIAVTVSVTDVGDEAPDAPDKPTVTTASSTSVDVSWTAPSNAGPPIEDYDARYREKDAATWEDANFNGTDTWTTLSLLTEDTEYEVQIRARNDEGTGAWSDSGTGRTASPDNQPPTFRDVSYALSVPENTTGTIGDPVTATDPEGAALTYRLSGGDASSFLVHPDTAQLSVPSSTDLNYERSVQYAFDLVAADPGGLTARLPVAITLTDVNEAPEPPSAPVVTTLSSSGLRADWAAPSNTGPPISRYDVRYRPAGASIDPSWISHPHGVAATTALIVGLAAGTSYDVQVRAINPEGESGWSVSGTGTTASSPPPGGGGGGGSVDQQPFFQPGVSIDDLALVAGSGVRVTLPAASGGDPPLRYGVTPRPPDGLGFDPETRALSGTPTRPSAALTYAYTATDNDGDAASLRFVIQVSAHDQSPSFGGASVPNQTFTVGVTARLELPAASGGNGELHYSLSPALPSGLGFDAGSRVVWGTPVAADDPATYTYRVTDSDAEDPDSDELRFTIAVATAPPPPGQSDVTASPAGEESVALILGPGWADLPRNEIDVEVRGPKHGWTPWPPRRPEARGTGSGAADAAGNAARSLRDGARRRPSVEARGRRQGQAAGTSGAVASAAAAARGILVEGLDRDSPYTFRLRTETPEGEVAYSEEQSATTGWFGGPCRRGAGFLCLRDGRFEVQAHWTNPDREADFGVGTAIPLAISDESGMFWFFNADNIELVTKVLDGRSINDHFWVFFGALSDVEYWVTVNDTSTGEARTYHNRPKEVCGQSDTSAFLRPLESSASASPASAAASSGRGSDWERIWGREPGVLGVDLLPMNAASFAVGEPAAAAPEQGSGVCEPSAERLCLLEDRFAVAVDLIDPNVEDPAERERVARVLPSLTTRETGFFWFFNDENVELAVKMLDGRAINGRFWLLYGGLSDVEYAITVTDTWTGLARVYRNEAGSICGEVDTGAFQ